MPHIDLGENYRIEEDDTGDLVVRDRETDDVVLRRDREAEAWTTDVLRAEEGVVGDLTGEYSTHIRAEDGRGTVTRDPSNFATGAEALRDLFDYLNDEDDSGKIEDEATVYLPHETALTVDSTLTIPVADFGGLHVFGPTGAADVSTNEATTRFESNISDGSTVIDMTSNSAGSTIKGITVIGNGGEDGTGMDITAEDTMDYGHLGVMGVGGTGIRVGGENVTVGRLQTARTGGPGLRIEAKASTVHHVECESSSSHAIRLHTAKNCVIENVIGQESEGRSLRDTHSDNCVVRNSRFNHPMSGANVKIAGSTDLTMRNCHVVESESGTGIILTDTRTLIEDCHIKESDVHIQFDGAERCIVRRTTFAGSGTRIAGDGVDCYVDLPDYDGEQRVSPDSDQYTATFDSAFTHWPRLNVEASGAAFERAVWEDATTNADGNYTAVPLAFDTAPANVTWKAVPRNVGV